MTNLSADIEAAIQVLADGFLNDIRSRGDIAGWGQYLRTPSRQIGLYGTCSGIICVSLAYGGDRIPDVVTEFINELWASRSTPGADGAKNHSLTARCAFLVLALRLADNKRLRMTQAEATADLLTRTNTDGLFKPWRVNSNDHSHESSEVATALALLAYTLAPATPPDLPNDLIRSATALQDRLSQRQPRNEGVKNLLLLATGMALGAARSSSLNKMINQAPIHEADEGQDTLDFWDYSWPASAGPERRRDYMHVPATAIELLLSTTSKRGEGGREKARQLTRSIVQKILAQRLFFGGREIATSKSQAWIALALHRTKVQLTSSAATPRRPGWLRRAWSMVAPL
jgi:hypothetical protein